MNLVLSSSTARFNMKLGNPRQGPGGLRTGPDCPSGRLAGRVPSQWRITGVVLLEKEEKVDDTVGDFGSLNRGSAAGRLAADGAMARMPRIFAEGGPPYAPEGALRFRDFMIDLESGPFSPG